MTQLLPTADARNWQTLLQIVRILPQDNQDDVVSFTNSADAIRYIEQNDSSECQLRLLTKDALQFWIVPATSVDKLIATGFYTVQTTKY